MKCSLNIIIQLLTLARFLQNWAADFAKRLAFIEYHQLPYVPQVALSIESHPTF